MKNETETIKDLMSNLSPANERENSSNQKPFCEMSPREMRNKKTSIDQKSLLLK